MSTTMAISSKSTWSPPVNQNNVPISKPLLPVMPLGGFKNHGQYQSRLRFRKRYQSVQASVNPIASKHRRAGQVTGLLLRSSDDQGYPDLPGQYTGPGNSYDLEEGEQIVDLEFTMVKPIC